MPDNSWRVLESFWKLSGIFRDNNRIYSGAAGFLAALVLAFCGAGLLKVAVGACGIVFLLELFFV